VTEPARTDWYRLGAAETVRRLGTDIVSGLSQAAGAERLAEHGPNTLTDHGVKSPWRILWEQLTSVLVLILIGAGAVSVFLGELTDAAAIIVIVVLNAVLGVMQEYRAEKAMAALRKLADPIVRVRRAGRTLDVPARELVPGDIVMLEAGSFVPADGRLVEVVNLRVQESALTGESEPVDKLSLVLRGDTLPVGDRRNMVYSGTVVVAGRGTLAVTETGMNTELGRLAVMLQGVKREPTPLQRRLEQLARGLAVAACAVAVIAFGLGLLRGESFRLMFMFAISMAVAAVPESLPAVVTISLTLGARRMLSRKALIRRLAAVETLGSVTVICSDKTGTLTQNVMTVTVLDVAGHRFELSGDPKQNGDESPCDKAPALALLLAGSALCSDAFLDPEPGGHERFRAIGDPTEAALVVAAARLGLDKATLEKSLPRVAEVQFSSERKRMSTVHRRDRRVAGTGVCHDAVASVLGDRVGMLVFSKGAVDSLLAVCSSAWMDGRCESLTEDVRQRIEEANNELARGGMRVLGVAFRSLEPDVDFSDAGQVERDMTFVGMTAMMDPARPEARKAVATCSSAGIRPIMITGDHPLTAARIAADLGIGTDAAVVSGVEIAAMSDTSFEAAVATTSVFARVAPEHKLRIVDALQKQGHIVAMTGDGVNDAPALKKADIGVAMGVVGTDVAKEASDMVLLNDNFATIVSAVREGRAIYDNIRKFIKFSIGGNIGKILVVVVGPFLGMPLPLLPLQILWLNLLTDGLLGLGLSVEPAERNVMQRPPRSPRESILGGGTGLHVLLVGLYIGAVALGLGYLFWRHDLGGRTWQTALFTTLAFLQIGQAVAVRSTHDSTFHIGLLSNRPQAFTAILTFGLQLAAVYVPFMQNVFRTVPLTAAQFAGCAIAGTSVFWAVELEKLVLRARDRRRARAT
jgi:Ca2+-transporting ATPase